MTLEATSKLSSSKSILAALEPSPELTLPNKAMSRLIKLPSKLLDKEKEEAKPEYNPELLGTVRAVVIPPLRL